MIQKVLREIAKNHKLLPQVVIQEFAEGSLDFVDEFWIKIHKISDDNKRRFGIYKRLCW